MKYYKNIALFCALFADVQAGGVTNEELRRTVGDKYPILADAGDYVWCRSKDEIATSDPPCTALQGPIEYIESDEQYPSLEWLQGELRIAANIDGSAFPNLKLIGHGVFLLRDEITDIAVLELPNVEKIGGKFEITNNPLCRLDLGNLKSVGDYENKIGEFIISNAKLENIDLNNLESVGRTLEFSSMPMLQELGLGNLEQVGGRVALEDIPLQKIVAPNLKRVAMAPDVNGIRIWNTGINELNLPRLRHLGGGITMHLDMGSPYEAMVRSIKLNLAKFRKFGSYDVAGFYVVTFDGYNACASLDLSEFGWRNLKSKSKFR